MKTNLTSIERLRQQRSEFKNSPESIGLVHGQLWAETRATYAELRRLAMWWNKFHSPAAGSKTILCYEVVAAINPDLGRYGERDAAHAMFLDGGTVAPEGIPNWYVADFVSGAVAVFSAVETLT